MSYKIFEECIQAAKANPDLPYDFIRGILMGLEEIERGEITEYVFD